MLFDIIVSNWGFILNLSIPIIIALYLVLTNREYIWKEFGIQTAATLAYVSIVFFAAFSFSTEIWDTNYYNGKVKSSTYYEEWTELVHYTESYPCGTSKAPRTCTRPKTRRDYHSPYYQIKTDLGETISIRRGDYLKTSREFGSKEVYLHRSGQVSFGDGNKFVSYPNKAIATSVGHSYENVVAAAKGNVIHLKVPKENIAQLVKIGILREYPSLYKGKYGETKLNRIIDTTGKVDLNTMLHLTNKLSTRVGETKQANPIIYIVSADKFDRSFKDALSQHWSMGKKNDITLVLGIDENKKIQWSDVICFTNNTDFIVDMQNNFDGKEVNPLILAEFEKLINSEYIRKPMAEFAYLKENITLDWKWQLLILLGNIIISGFIAYKFLNNQERKR